MAIPKKEHDIVKVGDLPPLILVGMVRKLWCKVLLQRMLAVWKSMMCCDTPNRDFVPDRVQ